MGKRFKASETLLGIETYRFASSTWLYMPIQSLWNPFRDWNYPVVSGGIAGGGTGGFKASETLLGIETRQDCFLDKFFSRIQSLWNPFRDWNIFVQRSKFFLSWFKASETLLGIETFSRFWHLVTHPRRRIQSLWNPFRDWNLFEPPRGIFQGITVIQSLWNPFRDWNVGDIEFCISSGRFKASETLLGIETYSWFQA